MKDDSRAMTIVVVGAVLGGLASYLLFTPQGRAVRRRCEPLLDDLGAELSQLRSTVAKASTATAEGWRLLTDSIGERASSSSSPYTSHRQASPF